MLCVPANVPTADPHVFKHDLLIMSCVMRSEIQRNPPITHQMLIDGERKGDMVLWYV